MKKSLPIVNSPTLVCTLPVSGNTVKYRPFVVAEQKSLLLAQQSEDERTIAETVKNVIQSCTNGTLDYDTAPTADVAYFFLKMQIASVGAERRVSIGCISCEEPIILNINLDAITVDTSNAKTTIQLTDTVGIKFRFPSLGDSFDVSKFDNKLDQNVGLLKKLIVSIYDEEQVYDPSEYTSEELTEWIMGLNDSQLIKIQEFIDNIPELRHELVYTCPHCKTKQRKLLEGLHDFFRLGDDQ